MKKKVVIDGKKYDLNLDECIDGKTTGNCYHLKNDEFDLAVKLYFDPFNKDSLDFPDLEDLEAFCEISEETSPVLVSKFPVFDAKERYIGCAAPYVYTSNEPIDSNHNIYHLPVEKVIGDLKKIQEKIDIFTENGIELCDWAVYNLVIGTGRELPFGIYMIDDSAYSVSMDVRRVLSCTNDTEMNHLVASIIEDYWNYYGYKTPLFSSYLERYTYSSNPLSLLEKECASYKTLGDCFNDYATKNFEKRKVYQMKSF